MSSLDKYKLNPSKFGEIDIIANGSSSSVALVYKNDQKDIQYALKKILSNGDDKVLYKDFMKEVSIMSNLNHRNLIKLVGYSLPSENYDSFHIYTNYISNRTLEKVIKDDERLLENDKTLNPTRLSIIVYGIASAMNYLHKHKILHNDLKPENIILNDQFNPIIIDFGFSKYFNDNESSNSGISGSPYFMAPELFLDEEEEEEEKNISKIDVYAFGVTLLSLFTTKYQFQGVQPRTISQLINRVINGKRFVIPPKVPQFYVSLIQRCWSSNPKERPSFEDIMKELNSSDNFIFDGANIEKVHEYIQNNQNFK